MHPTDQDPDDEATETPFKQAPEDEPSFLDLARQMRGRQRGFIPRPSPTAHAIRSGLSAPLEWLSTGEDSLKRFGTIVPFLDISPREYVLTLRRLLDDAWTVLDVVAATLHEHGHPTVEFSTRVNARVLVEDLFQWSVERLVEVIDGEDPNFQRIPMLTAGKLSELGRLLSMAWTEFQSMYAWPEPAIPAGEHGNLANEELDRIPDLSAKGTRWIRVKEVALRSSVSSNTLRNYRAAGQKSDGGEVGIDIQDRIWRKPSGNAHVLYLESSLSRKIKKHRG